MRDEGGVMEESCVFIIQMRGRLREKKALGYNGAPFYVQTREVRAVPIREDHCCLVSLIYYPA